jgi:rhodanese-related sulfurtransferase
MTFSAAAMRAALTGAFLALVFVITSCSSSEADSKVRVVKAREAVTLIASDDYVVIDLRPSGAFEAGHVSGARSLPYLEGDFQEHLAKLDPEARYLLYSRRADVVDRAADVLVSLGFDHVVNAGSFGLLALAGAEVE